jgi:hypothetical protein
MVIADRPSTEPDVRDNRILLLPWVRTARRCGVGAGDVVGLGVRRRSSVFSSLSFACKPLPHRLPLHSEA